MCLPHTRGGVSQCPKNCPLWLQSSPHPWGCFHRIITIETGRDVFPTPVGVFPDSPCQAEAHARLPHTRGGVSSAPPRPWRTISSSPHPWGCFRSIHGSAVDSTVFPTPVGVFPPATPTTGGKYGLPHTRGGVSKDADKSSSHISSSPHPWGCFPGMRPQDGAGGSLPHTRGGVSVSCRWTGTAALSSPHPWGCFRAPSAARRTKSVFPTPVGVFLRQDLTCGKCACLPHTRGGVSASPAHTAPPRLSSPHPWGCFSGQPGQRPHLQVFPTPVGVFPGPECAGVPAAGLPHTRGGVSADASSVFEVTASSPHPWGCFHHLL